MFRRILLSWLVVTILGYGMALSASVHHNQSPEASHSIESHLTADYSGQHDNSGDHDHCYHGSSHLVGLNIESVFDFASGRAILDTLYRYSIVNSPTFPFLRPPKLA